MDGTGFRSCESVACDEERKVDDDVALEATDADAGLAVGLSEWLGFRFFSADETHFSELPNASALPR